MRDNKANARRYYQRHRERLLEYYSVRYYSKQFEKLAEESNQTDNTGTSTGGVAEEPLTGVDGTTGVAAGGVGEATPTTACGLES